MVNEGKYKLYGGTDPRDLACYSISEAAWHTKVPSRTLRTWIKDDDSPQPTPLIIIPQGSIKYLSFNNLIEVFVLNAIRNKHNISMPKVRQAVGYLRTVFKSEHPLAEREFETDGIDLFFKDQSGEIINASRGGQMAFKEVIKPFLSRIEWDTEGHALKLYPFIKAFGDEDTRNVVINPFVSFGKPVITGTGIQTSIIAERYKAGDSIDILSSDYKCSLLQVEDAIRYEFSHAA